MENLFACHNDPVVAPGEAGLTERAAKDQIGYSIATLPPTLRQRQLAFLVVVVTLAAFGAVAPFSNAPLQRVDSFIPMIMAIIFVTDLVTAILLFGQFAVTGSRALLVLASGYLFSSLIAIPFTLTFPGAFVPIGLLGAGPQSAAWLNVSFRFGFTLAIVGYAQSPSLCRRQTSEPPARFAKYLMAIVLGHSVPLYSESRLH